MLMETAMVLAGFYARSGIDNFRPSGSCILLRAQPIGLGNIHESNNITPIPRLLSRMFKIIQKIELIRGTGRKGNNDVRSGTDVSLLGESGY